MKELLNPQLCRELRDVVNETDIFIRDKDENKKFNLTCAIMDRFDTVIEYINDINKLETEMEFITYMTGISIIRDGINYISKEIGLKVDSDSKIFESIYRSEPINLPKEIEYSDDRFFEYFRSLVFAHPFLTDRSIPNAIAGEKQYSPFVIINDMFLLDEKNSVGVMVYSNKRNDFTIVISFDTIKKYVREKYKKIKEIIKAYKKIIKVKQDEWKKHKVNRNLDLFDLLDDIKNILEERYMHNDEIEDIIKYLKCTNTINANEKIVNTYKNIIKSILPDICDALDNYEHEKIYTIVEKVLHLRPKGHKMMHYQLEKIFCYLTDEGYGDVQWGLKQAELFSNEFAKKWVIIKPYEMEFDEIKLLVTVACYFESLEERGMELKTDESI